MKKHLYTFTVAVSAAFTPCYVFAQPTQTPWHLPVAVSDKNTNVRFEVDSTWHTVEGIASDVSGELSLAEPDNAASVQVSLAIPVAKLDTDNSMRDDRMREILFADKYPEISFKANGLNKNCTPAIVQQDGKCKDSITGDLTILSTTKQVTIPITISNGANKGYVVSGKIPLKWAEYGVEDPSIIIAHVDPIVTVFFNISLEPQGDKAAE
jgi:polyisoprenoid-binding protein YceI